MLKHRLVAAGALVALAAVSLPAVAQSSLGGFALDQLEPAPAGDDFFAVRGGATPGHLEPRGYLMFDLALDPLTVTDGAAVVSEQAFLRADATLTLFDRLLFGLDVPIAVLQGGDDPTVAGVLIPSPDGAAMGDVRVDARGRLWGENRTPFQIAMGMSLWLPTAGDDTYAGDGGVRGQPHVAASGRVGDEHAFVWATSAGPVLRTSGNPSTVAYGLAAGASFADDTLQIGPELFGSTILGDESPLSTPEIEVAAPSTGLELLGGAKLRFLEGVVVGVAAGGGVADAIGVPTTRLVLMAGWVPAAPKPKDPNADGDGDGVPDARDACLDVKGEPSDDPARDGCAPPDRDDDGVADGVDACPGTRGRRSADPTKNGCPADYDRDGVADAADACPNQPGVASYEPARNGCPGEVDSDGDGIADRTDACRIVKGARNEDPAKHGCPEADGDRDGIADEDDACPNERGGPSDDEAQNGCPKDVRVTTGEIVILKQVRFQFGQASLEHTVDPVSDDLLTEVRDVIQQRTEIEVIEVQGHADDVGTTQVNQEISQRRAESVRSWLVRKGIDPKRLVARGYGSTVPIAPNTTEEGRQRNRRVQFVIVKAR